MIDQWVYLIIGLVLLAFSSERVVINALRISKNFHLSPFLIGFVLIAVLTNIPEFIIGIISALESENTLVLGTIMGSNIAEIFWVFGLSLIVANGFSIKKSEVVDHSLLVVFVTAMAMIFWWSDGISRIESVFLLGILIYYFFTVSRFDLVITTKPTKTDWLPPKRTNISPVIQFIIFLVLLIISAQIITSSAILIAQELLLPTAIIGTILAIGTTMPDLAVNLQAVRKKSYDIAIGNILGSCITNFTLVLGVSSLISPVPYFDQSLILVPTLFLFVSGLLIAYSVLIANQLPRIMGFIFVAIYGLFLLMQIQTIL